MAWTLAAGTLAWMMLGPGAVEAVPAEAEKGAAVEAAETEPDEAEGSEPGVPSVPEPEVEGGPERDAGTEPGVGERDAAPDDAVTAIGPSSPVPAPMPVMPVVVPPAPDHVRIHPPRYRGTGLFIGAGVAFGVVGLYQLGDALICDGCAIGVIERLGLAVGIAGATGGGVLRAMHDSWTDTAYARKRPSTKRFIVAGAVLAGVGGALGLANEMLWWGCWIGGGGPYAFTRTDEFGPWTDCRRSVGQPLVDGASALVATGGGLLGYGLTYRKRQGVFRRAKVIGTLPSLGVGRSGLSLRLGGRF